MNISAMGEKASPAKVVMATLLPGFLVTSSKALIKIRDNASKLRKIYVMVGCAVRTKIPTGRYLHGAHGAPYFDKTLNLLTRVL